MEESIYCYKYPHPAITTDCAIFTWDESMLKVLLIKRGIEPFKGKWALPGGFMNIDETAEECAQRELFEETGLRVDIADPNNIQHGFMSQLGAFSAVNRDPRERVVTIAFYALVKMEEVRSGDDAADAQWIAVNSLPQLAFDHRRILNMALERIREDLHFRPIGFTLLPSEFTMPQLQALYEAILGVTFDRRNFAKKILSLGLLKQKDMPKHFAPSPSYAKRVMPIHINRMDEDSDSEPEICDSLAYACYEDPTYHSERIRNEIDAELQGPKRDLESKRIRVGRAPTLYCFDNEKYQELKERGINRLEF